MEKTDRLWPGGWTLTFDDVSVKPSTDSFLLGAFPLLRRGERVCDLGAGIGLLSLLLLAREPSLAVTNVEQNEDACRLARRNAEENGLSVTHLCADLRDHDALPTAGSFDLVITNPPYFTTGSGVAAEGSRGDARCEQTATLEDIVRCAARLLRSGGRFALVYRTERLAELLRTVQTYHLEPKRLRLIQHRTDTPPSLLLLECRKDGHPGLAVEPVLLIRREDGSESDDVRSAYFREKENQL